MPFEPPREPQAFFLLTNGDRVPTTEDVTRAMASVKDALLNRESGRIGPMMNVPQPGTWTPKRGVLYRRINSYHVVEILDAALDEKP